MNDPELLAHASNAPPILALVIPIVAIVMGIGVIMLGIWVDYRKKREIFQLYHAERMAALEKGIEVPPLPPEFFQGRRPWGYTPWANLRRGLIATLIGSAVTANLYFKSGAHQEFGWGLVIVAYGLGELLFYALDAKRKAAQEKQPSGNTNPRIDS